MKLPMMLVHVAAELQPPLFDAHSSISTSSQFHVMYYEVMDVRLYWILTSGIIIIYKKKLQTIYLMSLSPPNTTLESFPCFKHFNTHVTLQQHFPISFFAVRFVAKRYIAANVSEGTNRNLHDRNTLVQLLALYTDPESHNAQRHRQIDGRTTGCCQ